MQGATEWNLEQLRKAVVADLEQAEIDPGVLREPFVETEPSNLAVHLTPAAAGSRATENDLPQAQVTADR